MFFSTTWRAAMVIALLLWTGAFVVALVDLVLVADIGHLGLLLAIGGATLNVLTKLDALEEREQSAFRLGQEAGVRSIR